MQDCNKNKNRKNKNVVILGSTGSIGKMTLEVIDNIGGYNVLALSTNKNIDLFKHQITKYHPKYVVISDDKEYEKFLKSERDFIARNKIIVFGGDDGLCDVLDCGKIDFVMASIVGAAGLRPIYKALQKGYKVAVANKEPLVIAGDILMKEAHKNKTKIFPVDSEHSAIFQCLLGENVDEVKRILLTASGGPFYRYKKDALKHVTVEEALAHPRWKMGRKITIDSATLMNKGFEVIEAHYLFDMPIDKIEVLIHPESIIHSMVEFVDGSVKAHLGKTDMKIPIQFSFTYPERLTIPDTKLDFARLKSLNFEAVDFEKFPCLGLAFDAIKAGDGYPVVLNAVDEILVDKFLNGKIGFTDIQKGLKKALDSFKPVKIKNIDDVLALDREIRSKKC